MFGRENQSKFVKGIAVLFSEDCINYHKPMTCNFKIRKANECTEKKGIRTT